MLIKVFCVVSMLSKLPPAVCLRGGGGGATGFMWNFHRYRLVLHNYVINTLAVILQFSWPVIKLVFPMGHEFLSKIIMCMYELAYYY